MKPLLLAMFCFLTACGFSQVPDSTAVVQTPAEATPKHRPLIFKVELAAPLVGNPNWNEEDPDTGEGEYWFLPAGINVKFGAGLRFARFFTVGAVAGIDSRLEHKLVVAPVFADLTISPPINDDVDLYANIGYGQAFALGRGSLSGLFRRVAIGVGGDEGHLFIELSQYQFYFRNMHGISSVAVGFAIKF